MAGLTAYRLRCEHMADPIGIDAIPPRLSWSLRAAANGAAQHAYQIQVASTAAALEAAPDLWDSGRVESGETQLITYGGAELRSRQRCFWRVRVWDEAGDSSPWATGYWEMGLLGGADWTAQWIYVEGAPNQRPDYRPSPELRHEFEVSRKTVRATAYVSARGLYRLHINGERVGHDELTPGWTEYEARIPYQTYDVTELLAAGRNAVALELGDGWYCGCLPYSTRLRSRSGVPPSAICQIVVESESGDIERVVTDSSWRGRLGPVLMSDRYRGEIYDARLEAAGWTSAGFDDSSWPGVQVAEAPPVRLCGKQAEPVRAVQEVPAKAITKPAFPGMHVVDFGQNLVGRVRLRAQGLPGLEVSLRHAEALHPDGLVYMNNLWDTTIQTDRYTFRSDQPEVFEPRFTVHGFRYVEVNGVLDLNLEDVTAVVLQSATPAVGEFECSDPMLSKLHSNIRWTQASNFVEVPTDCPQRSERMGWMGDAHLFSRTAWFSYDVAAFFTKWLEDVRLAQSDAGAFPNFVPREGNTAPGSSGWGDAGVLLPWTLADLYADHDLLARSFESMTRWVDYVAGLAPNGIFAPDHTFGDWLAVPPEMYEAVPREVFSTAFFAHSAATVAAAAARLGRTGEAAGYSRLFETIRAAFQAKFVSADGSIAGGTQTVYLLAIAFGLLAPDQEARAVGHLVADIESRGDRLTTGIVGTSLLLPTLARVGHLELALRLLSSHEYPSWGYAIDHGATTIWERWDGWTADRGFQTPAMNSFNHYALGSVGEFLYDRVGGLAPDPEQPGFGGVLIRPAPTAGVTFARTSFESPRGLYRVEWKSGDSGFQLEVEVPPGCSALVQLPGGGESATVGSGRHLLAAPAPAVLR